MHTCTGHLVTAIETKISQNNGAAVQVEKLVKTEQECEFCSSRANYIVFIKQH